MDDDSLAYVAITRLQNRYADVATRRAWAEMADLALPTARFSFDLQAGRVLEFVGPAALAEFGSRATAGYSFYEYLPLNTVVTVADDTSATGRFYALEIGVDAASGAWTEFYGFYFDEYACVESRWLFARRAFQILTHRTGSKITSFPMPNQQLGVTTT